MPEQAPSKVLSQFELVVRVPLSEDTTSEYIESVRTAALAGAHVILEKAGIEFMGVAQVVENVKAAPTKVPNENPRPAQFYSTELYDGQGTH